MEILIEILKGFLYGGLAALIGYLKNKELEEIDPKKALKTLCIGAILGGIAGSGTSIDQASNIIGNELGISSEVIKTFFMTSITILVDQLVKLVWRRFSLSKVWEKVKDFYSR